MLHHISWRYVLGVEIVWKIMIEAVIATGKTFARFIALLTETALTNAPLH